MHKVFLQQLKTIMPRDCQVLIVTDAGFRTDWFMLVRETGWHFEGRIRTKILYSKNQGGEWHLCQTLYAQATSTPTYIGNVLLTKQNQLVCEMYLYKEKSSEKKKKTRRINAGKMLEIYKKAHRDPWLLVTSLPHESKKADWVVSQYKRRMKIEHEFRDTKDVQWGIGLRYTRTLNPRRLELLLLIGAIAMFMLWLIGLSAERNKIHYSYQANTIKTHRVLSLIFLGLQVVLHGLEQITQADLIQTLKEIQYHETI